MQPWCSKPVLDNTRKGADIVCMYKERTGDNDTAGKRGPPKALGFEVNCPSQSSTLLRSTYDASGMGIKVDSLHSEAYAMNVPNYDVTFKQRRVKGVVPGELASQKDVNEKIKRQANIQDSADRVRL